MERETELKTARATGGPDEESGADAGDATTSRRDGPTTGIADESAIVSKTAMRMVEIIMILRELKRPEVRKDFLAGYIMRAPDPSMILGCLDALYDLIAPDFIDKVDVRTNHLEIMGVHACRLLQGSSESFPLQGQSDQLEQFTYGEWLEALTKLISCPYWETRGDRLSIKGEVAPKREIMQPVVDNGMSKSKGGSALHSQPEQPHRKKVTQSPRLQARNVRDLDEFGSFECIEIGDSSDDTSSDSDVDVLGGFPRIRKNKYYFKDVVSPEPFDIDGHLSLKSFLCDFERYFLTKYSGNERDFCRELGRFLEGEIKEAYTALGGSTLRYRKMKEKLLEWNKSQHVGKGYKRKAEFLKACMREGESYKLYCMRLQDLVNKAYPHDNFEALKLLKKRLLATVPDWFAKCVEKREEMKHMISSGAKLTWADIVEVAETQDKKNKKRCLYKDVGDVDGISKLMPLVRVSAAQSTGTQSPGVSPVTNSVPRTSSPQQPSRPVSTGQCNYCGWPGHTEVMCRRKAGVCYTCGDPGHIRSDCPNNQKASTSFRPTCSKCNGDHLGKDCPSRFQRVEVSYSSRGRGYLGARPKERSPQTMLEEPVVPEQRQRGYIRGGVYNPGRSRVEEVPSAVDQKNANFLYGEAIGGQVESMGKSSGN